MNTPTPNDGHDNDREHDAIRDALQRDAARVPEPAFDAALHYATLRRLRALAEGSPARPRFWLRPALVGAVAVIVLAIFVALRPSHLTPPVQPHAVAHSTPASTAPRASVLAYQTAADDGDAALFAMLDRDAATLLPASSPIFAATIQ